MFASLFGKKRDRFTLAELRRLNDVLVKHQPQTVTSASRETLVETFREIAELMIWGDQHEPAFFDLFVELKILTQFGRFMTPHRTARSSRRGAGLTLQLLQT
jgi:protein CLEC16A